jgi:hypothetical protein
MTSQEGIKSRPLRPPLGFSPQGTDRFQKVYDLRLCALAFRPQGRCGIMESSQERARVSQLLRQAETAGLSLERVRGRGYRLVAAPDFLDGCVKQFVKPLNFKCYG